jgi:hypothetical protein
MGMVPTHLLGPFGARTFPGLDPRVSVICAWFCAAEALVLVLAHIAAPLPYIPLKPIWIIRNPLKRIDHGLFRCKELVTWTEPIWIGEPQWVVPSVDEQPARIAQRILGSETAYCVCSAEFLPHVYRL